MPEAACSTCRFWKRLTDAARYSYDDDGEPESVPAGEDDFHRWGKCERQNQPDLPVVIFTQDASEYSSWMTTIETFSCSEWTSS